MPRTRTLLIGLTLLITACNGEHMLEPNGPPVAMVPVAESPAIPAAPLPVLTRQACAQSSGQCRQQ